MTDYSKLSRAALESHARAIEKALGHMVSDCTKREAELQTVRLRLAGMRQVQTFFHGK